MSFFYNLNKRLADLSAKQDAAHLAESKQAETVAQSPLTQALNEGQAKRLPGLPITKKDVEKKFGGSMIKMAQAAKDAGFSNARIAQAMDDLKQGKNPNDVAEAGYSAKAARAGKDIGKPGKNFSKIAKGAAERYGSKAAGERVAGAVLNKLRHPTNEGHCSACDCSPCECNSMEESAFQAAIGKKKYGEQGMKALQKAGREHASDKTMSNIRNRYDKYDESQGMADEGNAFTGKLKATPKGGSFKLGDKTFKDTSTIEEKKKAKPDYIDLDGDGNRKESMKKAAADKKRSTGTAFDKDYMDAQRKKEQGTGKFDVRKTSTGTVYTRKPETFDEPEGDTAADAGPKKKGRPKGPVKGPERVTAKAWKHKDGRKSKTKENLDTDGVMMTQPSNMSSESISPADRGEYNDEAGMTKDSLHTIVRHAKELERALRSNENLPEWVQEKIGQIKGMMSSVTDYIISTHERDAEQHMGREGITIVPESADFSGGEIQQAYRLAMFLKPFIKDPDAMKAQAELIKLLRYKLQQSNDTLGGVDQLKEKSVSKAQRKFMGMAHAMQKGERIKGASPELKKVAKTMKPSDTHDFAATKEKGLPEKVKAKKKESKAEVEETTVAGSVAPASGGKSKGGMQFGKGVYESMDRKFKQALTEGMSINVNMNQGSDGNPSKSITVSADGDDADKLSALLKMAGLGQGHEETCSGCGQSPCGCEEELDENSPDWPTNTEKLDADPNLRTYSGGLNGPKSTGQTTIPVVASQERRLHSESVELERSLFKLYKEFK
jgi:hypothetical protein